MGKYCRFCHETRPNEAFSGKGHSRMICKRCKRLPKEVLSEKMALEELFGFWEQSNISKKNKKRIKELLTSPSLAVQSFAQLTADVANVKPHRRRRAPWLYKHNRNLYQRVIDYFGDEYFLSDALENDLNELADVD